MIDESKIIITDDYMPQEDFNLIKGFIMGNEMAWYWVGNYGGGYPLMEHIFYSEKRGPELHVGTPMVNTTAFRYVDPLIARIKPAGLVRIRANCNWRTDINTMEQRAWHTDVPFECTTGIYYLHDSDGCTVLDNDGDPLEIETKANRFVEFPSSYQHAATPFTTPERRVLINFNFHRGHMSPNTTTIQSGISNPEHW
jgi:hypothetical protein